MENLHEIATNYFTKINSTSIIPTHDLVSDEIIETMAINNHKSWCDGKIKAGYTYGPITNDELKQSDRLVSWDNLCEEAKDASRNNAKETLRILEMTGYVPVPVDNLVRKITEQIHDSWVRDKLAKGYTYGEVRNDDPTKGKLTHRDMLPFNILLELYPEDAEYDFTTARGVVDQLMTHGFALAAV